MRGRAGYRYQLWSRWALTSEGLKISLLVTVHRAASVINQRKQLCHFIVRMFGCGIGELTLTSLQPI